MSQDKIKLESCEHVYVKVTDIKAARCTGRLQWERAYVLRREQRGFFMINLQDAWTVYMLYLS